MTRSAPRSLDQYLQQLREELELATQENAQIRATEDFREGLASFLEKRSPKWTGR